MKYKSVLAGSLGNRAIAVGLKWGFPDAALMVRSGS
jgi:hypothetical protein